MILSQQDELLLTHKLKEANCLRTRVAKTLEDREAQAKRTKREGRSELNEEEEKAKNDQSGESAVGTSLEF